MSYGVVAWADPENNSYTITIPGISDDFKFPAQHITYRELKVGETVEVVDINNWPPYKSCQIGNLRVRERTGLISYSRWFPASEMKSLNHLANLAYGFIYSSERNQRWQVECPLYRKGIVQSIQDVIYMTVAVELGGFTPNTKCATDYYSCGTAAFAVGDNVVVRFKNNVLTQPTVIGFWDDPEECVFENWSGGQAQLLCYNRRWDFYQMLTTQFPYFDQQTCNSWNMGYTINGAEQLVLHAWGRPQFGAQLATLGYLAWYAQNPTTLVWEYDRTYPGNYLEFRFPAIYFTNPSPTDPESYVQLTIQKWNADTEQGDEWTDFVVIAHEDASQAFVDSWGNDVRDLNDYYGTWKLDLTEYGWESGDRVAGVSIDYTLMPGEHLYWYCEFIDLY